MNWKVLFLENKPKALVQMATGADKVFTAITAAFRLLKFGKMNRILFLVDTRCLDEQAEQEFFAYIPNDDHQSFSDIYGVYQICISTIQRMHFILKGKELDRAAEETPFDRSVTADSKASKEVPITRNIRQNFSTVSL